MSNGALQPPQRPRETSSLDVECPSPPDLTGQLVKINDQCVAGGAFGDIYKCRHNGQEVAVKALRFGVNEIARDKLDNMLRRELGIWKRISHNNIVPFLGIAHGFGICGSISLVSLWMSNESLLKFLETHNDKLETMQRLQILLDVARGLHYLHSSRIVHGDLYPNNILLDADYTARLTDFGYASLLRNSPDALEYLQRSTVQPGAIRWVAPELLDPEETFRLSTECDIYSFGCNALQVFSGKKPWSEVRKDTAVIIRLTEGQNPGRPKSPTMNNSHWNFIRRCWSSPRKRPAADQLITSLEQLIRDCPPSRPLRDLFSSSSNSSGLNKSTPGIPSSNSTMTTPVSIRNRTAPAFSGSWKTYRRSSFKPDPSDFIIIFMGPTGAGKTNFINHLTGLAESRNARDLKSDTQDVTPYIIYHPSGFRIVLVDTPGFDNTYRSDSDILRVIGDWLMQRYPDGETLKVAGIAYLHRITDNHMSRPAYKNLQIFVQLCGNLPLHRVRLVTTMWDRAKDTRAAKDRETELRNDFWKDLIKDGAVTRQFNNTSTSAEAILEELLALGNEGDELLLQEELEQGKRLNETEAGKVLYYSRFQQLLVKQKRALKELADEAKNQNDPALAKSLQEEYDKVNDQLQKTFEEIREMKIPFHRWFSSLFKGKSRSKALTFD